LYFLALTLNLDTKRKFKRKSLRIHLIYFVY